MNNWKETTLVEVVTLQRVWPKLMKGEIKVKDTEKVTERVS